MGQGFLAAQGPWVTVGLSSQYVAVLAFSSGTRQVLTSIPDGHKNGVPLFLLFFVWLIGCLFLLG